MEALARLKERIVSAKEYREAIEKVAETDHSNQPVLVVSAYDPRTDVGPYIGIGKDMPPLAPRIIGSELNNSGFPVRIVLGAWNQEIRPSEAMINGLPLSILAVSCTMDIHFAHAARLIDDAYNLGDKRPAVFVGGATAAARPSRFLERQNGRNADLVFTGGTYALHELNRRIDESSDGKKTRRQTLEELINDNAISDIPGIFFRKQLPSGEVVLVDTGPQRMLRDLDALSNGLEAFSLVETPHNEVYLRPKPLTIEEVRSANMGRSGSRLFGILPELTTRGCDGPCSFCPIPTQNQGMLSRRSVDQVVSDIINGYGLGVKSFFGIDDNTFLDVEWAYHLAERLSSARIGGRSLGELLAFGTEARVDSTFRAILRHPDILYKAVAGGWKVLYLGIEDVNRRLVDKGQHLEMLVYIASEMKKAGMKLMPMLIHHDSQPYSGEGNGTLKQAKEDGAERVPIRVKLDEISLAVNGGSKRSFYVPRKETLNELKGTGEYDRRLEVISRKAEISGELAKLASERVMNDPDARKIYDATMRVSKNGFFGLKGQVQLMKVLGAHSIQITLITPLPATFMWEPSFYGRNVINRLGRAGIDYEGNCLTGKSGYGPEIWDGNHVIMTSPDSPKSPWQVQQEQLRAYSEFYNPFNLAKGIVRAAPEVSAVWMKDVLSSLGLCEPSSFRERIEAANKKAFAKYQAMGIAGVFLSIWRMRGFLWDLYTASRSGDIGRADAPPLPKLRIVQAGEVPTYPYHEGPSDVSLNGSVYPVYDMRSNPPILARFR